MFLPHFGRPQFLVMTLALIGGPATADELYQERVALPVHVSTDRTPGIVVGPAVVGRPVAQLTNATDSAVTRTLTEGDRVTHVGGKAVTTLIGYYDELTAVGADQTVRLTVQTGTATADWNARTDRLTVPKWLPVAEPKADRVVHIVLAGLTQDATIGPSVSVSVGRLRDEIKNRFPAENYKLCSVVAEKCTAAGVLAAVQAVPSGPDDAVVCFYLGHGEYDPTVGHSFPMSDGRLTRRALFDAVLARPGRLKILISDACNVLYNPKLQMLHKKQLVEYKGPTPLEQLLRYHSGVLDLNSSSEGEASWYDTTVGGWFTYSLLGCIDSSPMWGPTLTQLAKKESEFFLARRSPWLAPAQAGVIDPGIARLRDQKDMRLRVYSMALAADPVVEVRPAKIVALGASIVLNAPIPK